MKRIDTLIEFINFTGEFRKVIRAVKLIAEKRLENDAEHSYQLAMAVWYVIETQKFSLNKELAMKYALVHDLCEIYAGDNDPYLSNLTPGQKTEREKMGAEAVAKRYPDMTEMNKLITEYENKQTPESRFVYALDKLLPIINVYIEKSDYYENNNISYERWLNYITEKVSVSPEIKQYFDELNEMIKDNPKMWAK